MATFVEPSHSPRQLRLAGAGDLLDLGLRREIHRHLFGPEAQLRLRKLVVPCAFTAFTSRIAALGDTSAFWIPESACRASA
jgi:hypothetical protein